MKRLGICGFGDLWRLKIADYRDGGSGYCNQSGIRYGKQLRLDKTLKIYLVTGQWSLGTRKRTRDKGNQ
jgi:hypothetical protein